MSCESYRELASAAADGELGRDEQRELDAHLETCAGCRQFADILASLHDLAASAGPLRLPAARQREILRNTIGPSSIWSRVRDRIAGPGRAHRALSWAGSAAVLVLVVTVAVKLLSRHAEPPETAYPLHGYSRPFVRVTITESDIVSDRSTLKVSLTDSDIVESKTLILSGDEM